MIKRRCPASSGGMKFKIRGPSADLPSPVQPWSASRRCSASGRPGAEVLLRTQGAQLRYHCKQTPEKKIHC